MSEPRATQNTPTRNARIDEPFSHAIAMHTAGDLAEAERLYRQILAERPEHAEARYRLALLAIDVDQADIAEGLLCDAIRLRPAFAEALDALAGVLLTRGQPGRAIELLVQAIHIKPDFVAAYENLGRAYLGAGRANEAVQVLRAAMELVSKPGGDAMAGALEVGIGILLGAALEKLDRGVEAALLYRELLIRFPGNDDVRFELAAITGEPPPPRTPPGTIARLFDAYAPHFDQHLRYKLKYAGPEMMADAVREADGRSGLVVMDLGCGTGLCGIAFRAMASRLVGVDLAPGMIRQAGFRDLYDALYLSDLDIPLGNEPATYDLVVAGDVLVYIGDIDRLFQSVAAALRPAGTFVLTTESADGVDFTLTRARRYAHSADYVQRIAERHGLKVALTRDGVIRVENREPVRGNVVVLRKLD